MIHEKVQKMLTINHKEQIDHAVKTGLVKIDILQK